MALKDKYFTISEAAKELRVTRQTISRWITQGKIPAEKVGRETLIKKKDLHEYQRRRLSYEAAGQIINLLNVELNDYCREKGYISTDEVVKWDAPELGYGEFLAQKPDGTHRIFKLSEEEWDEMAASYFKPKLKAFLRDFAQIATKILKKSITKESSPKSGKGGKET